MNRDRRRRVVNEIRMLNTMISNCENIVAHMQETKDDEEVAYDGIPENLREGSRATASEEAIDALEEAIAQVEEVMEGLGAALDMLESI